MKQLRKLQELVRDTRGLSTVEYVIILVLIAAIAIGTWKVFGGNVKTALEGSNTEFQNNVNSSVPGSQTTG